MKINIGTLQFGFLENLRRREKKKRRGEIETCFFYNFQTVFSEMNRRIVIIKHAKKSRKRERETVALACNEAKCRREKIRMMISR